MNSHENEIRGISSERIHETKVKVWPGTFLNMASVYVAVVLDWEPQTSSGQLSKLVLD